MWSCGWFLSKWLCWRLAGNQLFLTTGGRWLKFLDEHVITLFHWQLIIDIKLPIKTFKHTIFKNPFVFLWHFHHFSVFPVRPFALCSFNCTSPGPSSSGPQPNNSVTTDLKECNSTSGECQNDYKEGCSGLPCGRWHVINLNVFKLRAL